jgi:hypothetical protein
LLDIDKTPSPSLGSINAARHECNGFGECLPFRRRNPLRGKEIEI